MGINIMIGVSLKSLLGKGVPAGFEPPVPPVAPVHKTGQCWEIFKANACILRVHVVTSLMKDLYGKLHKQGCGQHQEG